VAGDTQARRLPCDTDGSEDNAGAVLAPDARAGGTCISARKLLANNDGYSFYEALNDLVVTDPTRTNVNDYRVILVL
jgi:hydroxypyruvate reductase